MPRVKLIPWGVILLVPPPSGKRSRSREMTVRIWSPPSDSDTAKRTAEDIYGGEAIAAQANVPPLA